MAGKPLPPNPPSPKRGGGNRSGFPPPSPKRGGGPGGRGPAGPADRVIARGIEFLVNSARPDGSWPIDTNLANWVTTLSVNALAAAGNCDSLDRRDELLKWLLGPTDEGSSPLHGGGSGGLGLDR